jgi:hypothetical protein
MRERRTPQTHYLFLRIIAVVSRSSSPLTVVDLGKALDLPPQLVAHCIALHLYLARTRARELPIPPPVDYWVPSPSDTISRNMLEPREAGEMPIAQMAISAALNWIVSKFRGRLAALLSRAQRQSWCPPTRTAAARGLVPISRDRDGKS